MDLRPIIETLRSKRPLFHREADFQFALAWEIQSALPDANVRLEYSPAHEPYKYIDILVHYRGYVYPIELKYPTKKHTAMVGEEEFRLKDHSAQDLGKYDLVQDICRIESFSDHLPHFKHGFVLWLTNDPSYWTPPRRDGVGYAAFSVHHGVIKTGSMEWGESMGIGTIKGRESALRLRREYEILWHDYSNDGTRAGLFRYALLKVEADGSAITL